MKRLFVSVPMKGRTEKNIKNSIKQMHKMAELIFGEKLELISSYVKDCPPENSHQSVWYLGESIKKLSEADYFIGIQYTDFWKGCATEADIARRYGIRSTFVDVRECSFLQDAFEIERKHWEGCVPVCESAEPITAK